MDTKKIGRFIADARKKKKTYTGKTWRISKCN